MDTHGHRTRPWHLTPQRRCVPIYDVGKLTVPVSRTAAADFRMLHRLPARVPQSDATIPDAAGSDLYGCSHGPAGLLGGQTDDNVPGHTLGRVSNCFRSTL